MEQELGEINQEILRLQNLRDGMLKCDKDKKDAYVRSLVWTEDCHRSEEHTSELQSH